MLTSLQVLLRLATLRRLGVFICALATLLAAAGNASALEPAQTKTRVWGFELGGDNSAGLFRAASSGKHQGNRLERAEAASGSLLAARGLGALSQAGKFGIQPYNALTKALKGTGLQAHHLIEQRFAAVLGQNAKQGLSIAVTPAEHQAFTNAWRAAIPYGQGTANATRQQVMDAARQIYSGYPEILGALGF